MQATGGAAVLRRMILGFRLTQVIAVAARLNLADHLHEGPRSVQALARAAGVETGALRRVLRALASEGIFVERPDGEFETNELAGLLRSDGPASMRDVAILYSEPWIWQAYAHLLHSVRTGVPAFEHVHGQRFYDFFRAHPAQAETFQRAMTGFTAHEVTAIVSACDLSTARRVVDVGGGHGTLLAALLARHPHLRGIVFDLPEVIAGAQCAIRERGMQERCEAVAGDFFEGVPAGGDVHLLKSVLHNWHDDAAIRILRSCRNALSVGGRIIVAERIVAAGNAASEGKLFDINMMVTVGGQERTEDEYRALLQAAGLQLRRIIHTTSALGLIEAVAADTAA